MIVPISNPAVAVNGITSPQEYSTLVATESPVIFTFQRMTAAITSIESSGSPSYVVIINHTGETIPVGSVVRIYDALYDEMVEHEVDWTNTGVFTIATPYLERYKTDWLYFYSDTIEVNAYLEVWLKINDVYEPYSIKVRHNSKGIYTVDVSRYLMAKVNGDKMGEYSNNSDAEKNQSGKFTLEYAEHASGFAVSRINEGNTWYYLYAVRTKEQGSNLYEYWECEFINQFDRPIWWIGTPMDIQFWWNPKYSAIEMTKVYYDSGKNIIDEETIILNTASKGYLTSVRVDKDSIAENITSIEFILECT